MPMRIAVIGAGSAGVTAIKCCIEEGLDPICFEKSNDVGGLWHITDKELEDRTTVMDCTVANGSKEMSSYSDFPPPKEFPIYYPHTYFKKYLQLYVAQFHLEKYVHLQTEVVSVSETDDHLTSGRWNIKVKDVRNGHTTDHVVDAVFVCTGAVTKPVLPSFPGEDSFKGTIGHVRDYRNSVGYEGKRVVVVGLGNSAGALPVTSVMSHNSEIMDCEDPKSAVKSKGQGHTVLLSSRSGSWLIPRQSQGGVPADFALTRLMKYISDIIPTATIINIILRSKSNKRLDHVKYGLCPKYSPAMSSTLVNDELGFRLMSGKVKMKPGIAQLTESSVQFTDGTSVENVDAVVCATGYIPQYPFLSNDIVGEDKEQLYLAMFPMKRRTSTLSMIGCFRVKGPLLPLLEMQARYTAKVFKGDLHLPNQETMLAWVQENIRESRASRTYSLRGMTQVDLLRYREDLAKLIGCQPNLWKLFVTDFRLAMKCIFEPTTPYQFRLCGPNTWPGARDAIVGQIERTYYPLTDGKYSPKNNNSLFIWKYLLLVTITVCVICWYTGML